jgi:hypothetical protein
VPGKFLLFFLRELVPGKNFEEEGLTKKGIYIIIIIEVNPWKIHWIE